MLFIRKLRFAYGVCIGFTNGEYRIAIVDFICSSRGRKRELRFALDFLSGFTNEEYRIAIVDLIAPRGGGWKETGDFDPLSLSNTSPDPWGVSAAAGHYCCRGLTGI